MTEQHDLALFISGALAAGYAVAALVFLRFWRQTGDRLFALFAAAFALLLVQRVALALGANASLGTTWYYMLRLLAFTLILIAIVDKNRGS
jgi:alpha-D-ribose 1-methylphosphonate 5-triphosphate synthase subunit PhnI